MTDFETQIQNLPEKHREWVWGGIYKNENKSAPAERLEKCKHGNSRSFYKKAKNSKPAAAETESDTISATLFMMKMITTKFSRKMSTWVGAESLRDIF